MAHEHYKCGLPDCDFCDEVYDGRFSIPEYPMGKEPVTFIERMRMEARVEEERIREHRMQEIHEKSQEMIKNEDWEGLQTLVPELCPDQPARKKVPPPPLSESPTEMDDPGLQSASRSEAELEGELQDAMGFLKIGKEDKPTQAMDIPGAVKPRSHTVYKPHHARSRRNTVDRPPNPTLQQTVPTSPPPPPQLPSRPSAVRPPELKPSMITKDRRLEGFGSAIEPVGNFSLPARGSHTMPKPNKFVVGSDSIWKNPNVPSIPTRYSNRSANVPPQTFEKRVLSSSATVSGGLSELWTKTYGHNYKLPRKVSPPSYDDIWIKKTENKLENPPTITPAKTKTGRGRSHTIGGPPPRQPLEPVLSPSHAQRYSFQSPAEKSTAKFSLPKTAQRPRPRSNSLNLGSPARPGRAKAAKTAEQRLSRARTVSLRRLRGESSDNKKSSRYGWGTMGNSNTFSSLGAKVERSRTKEIVHGIGVDNVWTPKVEIEPGADNGYDGDEE